MAANTTWPMWPWTTTITSSTSTSDTIWHAWTSTSITSTSYTTCTSFTNSVQAYVWQRWDEMPQPNGRCPLTGTTRPDGVDREYVYDWADRDWCARDVYDARQIARQEAADARREIEQAEHAAAEAKAEELLLSLLDEPARDRYLADGVVEVRVESGRLYELKKGWAGNVAELDPRTRRRTRRFCIHPRESMPVGDNLIAQLLLLQSDEPEFLRIANAAALRAGV